MCALAGNALLTFIHASNLVLAFTIANGVPKVGTLLSAVWNLDAVCRFKISPAGVMPTNNVSEKRESNGSGSTTPIKSNQKETADRIDMPPPPSPASSTCSDTGSITTSHSTCQKRVSFFMKEIFLM